MASSVVECQECNPQFVLNPMRILSNASSAFGRNIKLQYLGCLPERENRRFTIKAVSLLYASAGAKWRINMDYNLQNKTN